jgi:hypothetical protein
MTATSATNPLAALALDPRVYWLRAHKLAVARVHRANTAYEHTWRSGQPAWAEWQALKIAHQRAAYCYRQLCARGW